MKFVKYYEEKLDNTYSESVQATSFSKCEQWTIFIFALSCSILLGILISSRKQDTEEDKLIVCLLVVVSFGLIVLLTFAMVLMCKVYCYFD